jgi:hypothetical protein
MNSNMKKNFAFIIIILALSSYKGFSQMQASLGPGSQPNSIFIYLKPGVTLANTSISTLQFNVGIDTTGVITAPTLTVLSSVFTGVTWTVGTPYKEGGYWNYNILTGSGGYLFSLTANTEFEAMEVAFTGGVPPLANVSLVTLPLGGVTTGNAVFLFSGGVGATDIVSDGSNLYYTRSGVTVNNQFSYDPTESSGTSTSVAFLGSIVVPVKFTGFSAVKKDDNAILNWSVVNENTAGDSYEVERSFDGVSFTNIASVPVKGNSSSNVYNYTDDNLSSLPSTGTIYYRIEQVDKTGQPAYTNIQAVSLSNGIVVGAYPNPVKDDVTVTIDLLAASNLSINITDALGKQLQLIQLAGVKGSNLTNINLSGYASGNYLLKVTSNSGATTLPLVKE